MCIIIAVGPEIEYWEESDTEIMDDMDQPIPQDMNEGKLNVITHLVDSFVCIFIPDPPFHTRESNRVASLLLFSPFEVFGEVFRVYSGSCRSFSIISLPNEQVHGKA